MSFTLIPPTAGRVTSPFGYRIHPKTGKRSLHKGVDIAIPGKHNVVAVENGTVHMVVTNPNHWGYGLTVVIRHDGFDTLYAHLDAINVRQGQRVSRGQKIGLQGNTGTSTAQHLHFEVHIPRYESFQPHVKDPLKYIVWPGMKSLQQNLNKLGYKVTVDGILGQQTFLAIKAFQEKHKLVVDGIPGTNTLAAVKKALEPKKEEGKPVSNPKPVDTNKPSKWAEKEWQRGIELGITEGGRPQDAATREEVVAMMVRLHDKLQK